MVGYVLNIKNIINGKFCIVIKSSCVYKLFICIFYKWLKFICICKIVKLFGKMKELKVFEEIGIYIFYFVV